MIMLTLSQSSLLAPSNVLTSQRIVDVVLRAFKASAASQGDMSNLTFGAGGVDPEGKHVQGWAQYETICGGSGAGPSWHGTTCHTHMTNTRISDVEVMERSLPVLLRRFEIRQGSGGKGKYNGGDGVVRDIEFLPEEIGVSILSERRVLRPFGLEGGGDAEGGRNLWVKCERDEKGRLIGKREVNMGGKNTVTARRGDRIVIETPGGGGWGTPGDEKQEKRANGHHGGRGARGSVAERQSAQLGA